MGKDRHRKRRGSGERHVRIPLYMLQSPAWRSLSLAARAVFVEALAFYRGDNNGWIALGARMLAERTNISRQTASRALTELCDKGFLDLTHFGTFSRKDQRASEYRITLHKCDRDFRRASNAFMEWMKMDADKVWPHQRARTASPEGPKKENYPSRPHQRARGSSSEPPKREPRPHQRATDNLPPGVQTKSAVPSAYPDLPRSPPTELQARLRADRIRAIAVLDEIISRQATADEAP